FDHVRFGSKIQIGLDGRGPIHHVEATRSDLRHIASHDAVTLFWHPRHVLEGPCRRKTEAQETKSERPAGTVALLQVLLRFSCRFMNGTKGCSGKLKLPTGFETDRCSRLTNRTFQCDHVAVFNNGF